MDLNTVKAGGNCTLGCFYKTVDDMLDIKLVHFVRNRIWLSGQRIFLLRSEGAGGNGSHGWIDLGPSHAAAMKHLHDGNAAMLLYGPDHGLPGLYLAPGSHACLA